MPESRPAKRRLWPWVLFSLGCSAFAALSMQWSQPWLFTADLYSGQEGRMRPEPGLPGQINSVQVSPGGVVWVQAKDNLCRKGSTGWECTSGETAGAGPFYADFVLDGEAVWGLGSRGASLFDGAGWRPYRGTARPLSLVAGKAGTWMIDLDHRLFRFLDGKWVAEAGTLPLKRRDPKKYTPPPSLGLTPGGSLWLFASGQSLWRRNGPDWETVIPGDHPIQHAYRMEARSGRLWFLEKSGVLEFDPASNRMEAYSADRFGLGRDARLTQVVQSAARSFVLTETDWFQLVDGKLRKMPPPSLERPRVSRLAVAPDGTLWTVAGEPTGHLRRRLWTIGAVAVVLGVAGLVPVLLILRRRAGGLLGGFKASAEMATEVGVTQRIHSKAPAPVVAALFLAMGILFWVNRNHSSLVMLGLAALMMVLPLAGQILIQWAAWSGRYSAALRLARLLHWVPGPASALSKLNEAAVYFYQGKLPDAEAAVREHLTTSMDSELTALSMVLLGQVLTHQDRWEEAGKAFDTACPRLPFYADANAELAEFYLRRNVAPQQALEFAERAYAFAGKNPLRWLSSGKGVAQSLRAWALARLGSGDKAREAVARAVREAGRGNRAEAAGVHVRSAEALRILGLRLEAGEHLREAASLDPDGLWGRRAADALRQA